MMLHKLQQYINDHPQQLLSKVAHWGAGKGFTHSRNPLISLKRLLPLILKVLAILCISYGKRIKSPKVILKIWDHEHISYILSYIKFYYIKHHSTNKTSEHSQANCFPLFKVLW